MEWKELFKKTRRPESGARNIHTAQPEVPEGLMKKCNACKAAILTEDVKKNYYICPKCHNYFRVHALPAGGDDRRSGEVLRSGIAESQRATPLNFEGYPDKVEALRRKQSWTRLRLPGEAHRLTEARRR